MKHFISNGRFGDIVHTLPAVYEYALRTGTRPRMTVAGEFSNVLEGCSYIEGYGAPVPWVNINGVLAWAKQKFPGDDFVVTACYGKDYGPGYKCWSFLRDTWRLTGCPTPPESQPLVFDKRNHVREQALMRQFNLSSTDKYIVVCTAGKSSPFSNTQMLLLDIHSARPDCRVIDVSTVKADRVYDLLGLFEKAQALVTIDTLHLHLAAACPGLPVFALICNGPTRWNRTDWRPQHWWRATYAEYPLRRDLFRDALTALSPSTPHIYHVWNDYPATGDSVRRRLVARESWAQEAVRSTNWTITGVNQSELGRSMSNDGHLAYILDLIEVSARQCKLDTDIISVSNADVGCVAGITGQVLDAVREHGCAFTHRHDVEGRKIDAPIVSESEVGQLRWYPGSDWFFMSKAWWNQHGDEFPDMVMGREYWDAVLRQLMKKYGGREITWAVWHEKHESLWDRPGLRETLPGNVHNRALAVKWFALNRSDAQDPFRSTWNIQPGITTPVPPPKGNLVPTRTGHSNLVFPNRFQFHQNLVRPIRR